MIKSEKITRGPKKTIIPPRGQNLIQNFIIYYGILPKKCTSFSNFKDISSYVPLGIFWKIFRDVIRIIESLFKLSKESDSLFRKWSNVTYSTKAKLNNIIQIIQSKAFLKCWHFLPIRIRFCPHGGSVVFWDPRVIFSDLINKT